MLSYHSTIPLLITEITFWHYYRTGEIGVFGMDLNIMVAKYSTHYLEMSVSLLQTLPFCAYGDGDTVKMKHLLGLVYMHHVSIALIIYMVPICSSKFSADIPNSLMTISPGTENPNLSTPTTLEAYFYHISVTPASIAIIFVRQCDVLDLST